MSSAVVGALRSGITNPVLKYSVLAEDTKTKTGSLRLCQLTEGVLIPLEAPCVFSMVDSLVGDDATPFLEYCKEKGYQISISPDGIVSVATEYNEDALALDVKLAVYGLDPKNVTYFECTDADLLSMEGNVFYKLQEG